MGMKSNLNERRPAKMQSQLLAILVGTVSAAAANVAYYFFLKEFVGVLFIAPTEGRIDPTRISPLPYSDVIIFSLVYCIGASIVFLIIANTVRKPALVFVIISVVVLILSLFLPFFIPTPPVPILTKMSLASMHILGAAVLVTTLVVIGLPRDTQDVST